MLSVTTAFPKLLLCPGVLQGLELNSAEAFGLLDRVDTSLFSGTSVTVCLSQFRSSLEEMDLKK